MLGDRVLYVTPAELEELGDRVRGLLGEYFERLVRPELRPPGAPGKGDAMRALLADVKPAAAISLGDDRSDALAFGVLAEARAEGRCATLSVAVLGHPDAPNEIVAAADAVLASPADAARFLAGVAAGVRRGA